jgi:succinylarginine dihydrolase
MMQEWQFDGLVGPTHNYAGLAVGNLAAARNAGAASNPRLAAEQGLQKMRFVRDLGVPQAILPPHFRPMIPELKRLGFTGTTGQILDAAATHAPGLLASVYSSSFMWAAKCATICPSSDSLDGRLHLTPANLVSHYHRSLEAKFSFQVLQNIFHNQKLFTVHNYLSSCPELGDEGAANHMILKLDNGNNSYHIFVYGEHHRMTSEMKIRYPSRQRRAASEAVARLHGLNPSSCIYLQQSPEAIDQGVFHNDVIVMNSGSLMIAHAGAFIPEHQQILRAAGIVWEGFSYNEVNANELNIADAVATYLFNSQLLQLSGDKFMLVAPIECANHPAAKKTIDRFLEEGVLHGVHYLDVRESMRNGGGPACLRLRIPMTQVEAAAIHPGVILTDEKYNLLMQWVESYYRDKLVFNDLRDPLFVGELETAYAELENIIGMKGLYALA